MREALFWAFGVTLPLHAALDRLLCGGAPWLFTLLRGAGFALLPVLVMGWLCHRFRRLCEPGVDHLSRTDLWMWTFWIGFASIPVHLVFRPLLGRLVPGP